MVASRGAATDEVLKEIIFSLDVQLFPWKHFVHMRTCAVMYYQYMHMPRAGPQVSAPLKTLKHQ